MYHCNTVNDFPIYTKKAKLIMNFTMKYTQIEKLTTWMEYRKHVGVSKTKKIISTSNPLLRGVVLLRELK